MTKNERFLNLDNWINFGFGVNEHKTLLGEPERIAIIEKAADSENLAQQQLDALKAEKEDSKKNARRVEYESIDTKTKVLIANIISGVRAKHGVLIGSWSNDSTSYRSFQDEFIETGKTRASFKKYLKKDGSQSLNDEKEAKIKHQVSMHSIAEIIEWATNVNLISDTH